MHPPVVFQAEGVNFGRLAGGILARALQDESPGEEEFWEAEINRPPLNGCKLVASWLQVGCKLVVSWL